MTNTEISQWIDNDEGLYNWWKSTRPRQSKTAFIKENRQELIRLISNVTTGQQPAHYTAYPRNVEQLADAFYTTGMRSVSRR